MSHLTLNSGFSNSRDVQLRVSVLRLVTWGSLRSPRPPSVVAFSCSTASFSCRHGDRQSPGGCRHGHPWKSASPICPAMMISCAIELQVEWQPSEAAFRVAVWQSKTDSERASHCITGRHCQCGDSDRICHSGWSLQVALRASDHILSPPLKLRQCLIL